jgi:cytochrome c peroxidase
MPVIKSNPTTPEKVALGQMLFFDPRLSGSGVISCATCHNPALGWTDALPKGLGHMGGRLRRRTPTILNVAYGEPYFWDGRAATLEDQAKGPLTSAAEMNMPAEVAVKRILSIPGYVTAFAYAFPAKPVSVDTIAAAIASYERTVVSNSAPFDKWVAGDEGAISPAAQRGFSFARHHPPVAPMKLVVPSERVMNQAGLLCLVTAVMLAGGVRAAAPITVTQKGPAIQC